MLRHLKKLYFLSFASLFISCDPCLSIRSCADTFAFKIVDKSSAQDLVFGSSPIYNSDSVYLLTNLPGYAGAISRVDNNKFLSTLLIPTDTLFLRLTSTDTDTLFLSYDYIKTKCCNYSSRGYGKLQSIKYNQKIAIQEGETYVFKK